MSISRLAKTPKLEVALQLTETTAPETDGRLWEVHDVERNRAFRASLTSAALRETPAGEKAIGRPWTDAEMDAAIGLAIERALVTPPEKVPGTLYEVDVTSADLFDASHLR